MGLFKKTKNDHQYDEDYMDDEYIDDEYGNDEYANQNTQYGNGYNDYYDEDEETSMHNLLSKKRSKKDKPKKNSILGNLHSLQEESIEDDFYEDYSTDDFLNEENDEEDNKINIKSVFMLVFSFFYCLFLILGVVSTTFSEGYKPQIITPKIKSERVMYYQVQEQIDTLDKMDSFKGVSELKDIMKTGNYQSRIPRLKESLKTVNDEIEKMNTAAYKINQDDYINAEMLSMSTDLLSSMKETLSLSIKYYESASGYSSTTDALKASQSDLLNQYQIYNNKLANYKNRLEQIKYYDLKLEE